MKLDIFLDKMNRAGDAYVYYVSPVSKKQKYHVCTLELDNCEYIQNKLKARARMADPLEGQVRAFCWDLDDFKIIDVSQVNNVVPLSSMIKQDN